MPSEEQCTLLEDMIKQTDAKIGSMEASFHNHIREVRVDLSDHIRTQMENHAEILESHRLNTEAINNLTASTQGLVEAWQTANGAIRAVSVLGRVIKWVVSLGIAIGAVIAYIKGGFGWHG